MGRYTLATYPPTFLKCVARVEMYPAKSAIVPHRFGIDPATYGTCLDWFLHRSDHVPYLSAGALGQFARGSNVFGPVWDRSDRVLDVSGEIYFRSEAVSDCSEADFYCCDRIGNRSDSLQSSVARFADRVDRV